MCPPAAVGRDGMAAVISLPSSQICSCLALRPVSAATSRELYVLFNRVWSTDHRGIPPFIEHSNRSTTWVNTQMTGFEDYASRSAVAAPAKSFSVSPPSLCVE